MALVLKGDKEKLKEYRERAKEEGLEVVLYTDKDIDVKIQLTAPLDIDSAELLALPDHLRKTALALYQLERGTAGEVAKITKRARAVESGYLNQLTLGGRVKKERVGRKVYFSI